MITNFLEDLIYTEFVLTMEIMKTFSLHLGGFGAGAGFGVSQAIHLIASGLFCIMQVSHSQVPVGLTNLAIRGSSLLGGLAEAVVTVGAFSEEDRVWKKLKKKKNLD